ncbi:ITFG2, partial [Cervus elaphus hippelaphus]
LNELVVGDTSGKLSVYKNDDSRPWLTCSCQGMLTCVGVGDVCNKGKVRSPGAPRLPLAYPRFPCSDHQPPPLPHLTQNLVVAVSAEGWFHLCDLTPAKSLDGSGHHETLGGEEQRPVFKQHIPANTKVMLISDIDGDGRCELVVGYTDRVVRAFRWEDLGDGAEHPAGQLVSLKKWMLEGQPPVSPHPLVQVDSLSVTPGPLGVPELMVSQPGCAYAILLCTWNKDPGAPPTSEGPMEGTRGSLLLLHPLSGLFQGNGHEEVVACAWDGQTYIIDHNRTVVRFQVDENIRAFCAGLYACKDSRNSPCLVYVTFNQKIYVYWEVQLERMESTNLLKVLEAQPEFRELLGELGVDPDELPAARALLHQTLYHPDQPPQCAPAGPQDPT